MFKVTLATVFAPVTAARQVDVPTAHLLLSTFMMGVSHTKGDIPNSIIRSHKWANDHAHQ